MIELSALLDRACARLGATSDRAFCRALRWDGRSLLDYRRGTSWPDDERMVRLCDVSGISREGGLLLLNIWRSKGDTRTAYRRIFKIWEASGGALFNKEFSRTPVEQIHM